MTDLMVSIAGPDDIGALVESVAGLFQEDGGRHDPHMDTEWPARDGEASYGREVDDPALLLLLARTGERVVGHLVGRYREPNAIRRCRLALLESIRVAPDARGRGVGGRLVEEFLGWARAHGAEVAQVTAYAANDGARRFYARHGFTPHEVTMRTPLDDATR